MAAQVIATPADCSTCNLALGMSMIVVSTFDVKRGWRLTPWWDAQASLS